MINSLLTRLQRPGADQTLCFPLALLSHLAEPKISPPDCRLMSSWTDWSGSFKNQHPVLLLEDALIHSEQKIPVVQRGANALLDLKRMLENERISSV